jgi:hypothetical protein
VELFNGVGIQYSDLAPWVGKGEGVRDDAVKDSGRAGNQGTSGDIAVDKGGKVKERRLISVLIHLKYSSEIGRSPRSRPVEHTLSTSEEAPARAVRVWIRVKGVENGLCAVAR